MEFAPLQHQVSTVALIEQAKQCLYIGTFVSFVNFVATVGSPASLERQGKARGIKLVAICKLIARCNLIPHTGPLGIHQM